jgi:hypothetical protein
MKEAKMKLTIELDETQLSYLTGALELHTRLMMGQFDALALLYFERTNVNGQYKNFQDKLDELKLVAFPELPLHSNYGIGGKETPASSKITYELYKAIRYEKWRLAPNGEHTVDSSPPLEVSGHPLPKVTITSNEAT